MSTDRFVSACGLVFVLFTVAGFLILARAQAGGGDTTISASEWIQDSDHQALIVVGLILMALGGLAFLGLSAGLVVRMQLAGVSPIAAEIARMAGAGFAIIQVIAAAGMGSGAMILISDFEGASSDPGLGRLAAYGFITWQMAAFPVASAFVGAVSYATFSRNMLPRWLGIIGALCSVLLLLSFLFLPVLSLPVWAICVSAVLLVRGNVPATPRSEALPA